MSPNTTPNLKISSSHSTHWNVTFLIPECELTRYAAFKSCEFIDITTFKSDLSLRIFPISVTDKMNSGECPLSQGFLSRLCWHEEILSVAVCTHFSTVTACTVGRPSWAAGSGEAHGADVNWHSPVWRKLTLSPPPTHFSLFHIINELLLLSFPIRSPPCFPQGSVWPL
jgi:hypothetical protein